jgi:hypothetical protein
MCHSTLRHLSILSFSLFSSSLEWFHWDTCVSIAYARTFISRSASHARVCYFVSIPRLPQYDVVQRVTGRVDVVVS